MTATNPDAKQDAKESSEITTENSNQHDEIPSVSEKTEIAVPTTSSSSTSSLSNDENNTTSTTNNISNIPTPPDETNLISMPNSPSSSSSTSKNNGDSTFEPTVDMMVNDFDDEATLEEEEALAAQESDDPSAELSNLQKESDMPIEELLALYNCNPPVMLNIRGGRSGATKRGKKRRKLLMMASSSHSNPDTPIIPLKKDKKSSECIEEPTANDNKNDEESITEIIVPDVEKCDADGNNDEKLDGDDDIEEDISDGDGETEIDGTGVDCDDDDDDDDGDSKEISQLSKLYPETYGNSEDKRLLRTISRQQSDEEEDVDYSPDEDEKKKTIMVGSEFQAVIPEGFSKYDDVLPYENEDKLLWDPNRMTEDQTEEYLTKAHEQAKASNSSNNSNQIGIDTIPCGKHLRDDEQALYLLLQCGHNTEEALRRKRINPVPSTEQMSIWSEEECRNFESVLRLYGKDFHTIKHAKVHTRSVGELVQFYYLWKKTERHDVFANKGRLEKKKYNLNPGLTDYMDRFLEELDTSNSTGNNTTANNSNSNSLPLCDRSSSPSSSGVNGGGGGGGSGGSGGGPIFDGSGVPFSALTSTAPTATITSATETVVECEQNSIVAQANPDDTATSSSIT